MWKKIAFTLLSVLALIMMTSCSDSINEGDVYDKEFKPEYTTVSVLPMTISNGKTVTTIMVPYAIHYPDRWVIYIKAYDEETCKWINEDFYVSEEVYDSVNIGDYFVFDEDMGTRDEPYTKTRK